MNKEYLLPLRAFSRWMVGGFIVLWILVGCSALPVNQKPPLTTSMPAPTPTLRAQPTTEADLADDATLEQLAQMAVPGRDLADLTLRLNPAIDEIPPVVNATTPNYDIGDRIEFWVHNTDTNSNDKVLAELIEKTDVAYAWVTVGEPHDANEISRSIRRFSNRIYPAAHAAFGAEWTPGVDNDPRVHILMTTGMGNGVAGYFSGADENNRLAFPTSNEKEMFYISLDWLNRLPDYAVFETVLAHEFQHMIHWAHDRTEEVWLNEGLSEYAQEVAGYNPDTEFANYFTTVPDTQLNTWNEANQNNTAHYGAAYLFVAYLVQRFGPEMTQALVDEPGNGIVGIQRVLSQRDSSLDFDTLFADWVVANYADSRAGAELDVNYAYANFELAPPADDQQFDAYPVAPTTNKVANYATDYIVLYGDDSGNGSDNGNVTVDFDGADGTQLVGTQAASGRFAWWSNRADDGDSRLTRRFDLTTVTTTLPITMSVAMWYDIEDGYDFGYVMASRDGRKWEILSGQHTVVDNQSGNSLGAGYSGVSGGSGASNATPRWIEETFDLSAYAGAEVFLRFELVSDDAVNRPGWLIDDLAIPAIGYSSDFEDGVGDWLSEGWIYTDGLLPQRWLVQVLAFDGERLTQVQRLPVDDAGRTTLDINGLGKGQTAVIAISGLTRFSTEPAVYTFEVKKRVN